MALTAGTIYQIQDTATTGNVNGAGFNPASANFLTDLAATSATGSSPVVTSASYTFVAGDVGSLVYVKSGTNWTPGWYPIASVATGAATLNAAIGAVLLTIDAVGNCAYNMVAGCATVASPTAGTFGVDYSQLDTAIAASSTATSSGAGSVILFAGATVSMIGNLVNVISGTNFTAGWYEITAATAGVSITTDRASTTGVGATGVINVGGAGRFNGLENTFQASLPAGFICFIKKGSYTFSGATATANTNSTATQQGFYTGYNALRGDTCVGSNRPVINMTTFTWTMAAGITPRNLNANGSATSVITLGNLSSGASNIKVLNTSTTANRTALTVAQGNCTVRDCELVSQNGVAATVSGGATNITGCYIHDSATGINSTVAGTTIVDNIFEGCTTAAITVSVAVPQMHLIQNNTIYGREAQMGIGLNVSTANGSPNSALNNIFYGLATGISVNTGSAGRNFGRNNDFFNNATDVTNWIKAASDLAVNPTFSNVSQLTNSGTVTTSGSVLTDTTANFSGVQDNVDFLHVLVNTGGSTGCFLITSHTTTTLTVNNSLGTGSATTYWIGQGHNFQIGTNLKGAGFQNFTNATGGQTTSYPDVGAVQRQEPAGTGGGTYFFAG